MKTNSIPNNPLAAMCISKFLTGGLLTALVNQCLKPDFAGMNSHWNRRRAKLMAAAGAVALLAGASGAGAATLSDFNSTWNELSTSSNPPKLTDIAPKVAVRYQMKVDYKPAEKKANVTCWVQIDYSDTSDKTASEKIPVTYPALAIARMKEYSAPGLKTATLTGIAHNGAPACPVQPNTVTTMTISDTRTPSPQKGAAKGVAAPQAPGQDQQGQKLINSKPKLTKVTLAQTEISPGMVELMANVQSFGTAEACKVKVTVMTRIPGNDAINTVVAGPITIAFALPSAAQKFLIGTISATGNYRLVVDADAANTNANPICVGNASADFEIKRFKLSIATNITGVKLVDDGYDKTNKFWMVNIEGKSDTPCGYVVRLKHEATGKTIEKTGIGTLPLGQGMDFDQVPAPGQYLATVGPWTPVPVSDVPACFGGIKSTSAHLAGPKLGALNMMTIDSSTVTITTAFGNSTFDTDGTLSSLTMPKAISMDVRIINQPYQANCAYTLTVAKDGVKKAVAYNTGQPADVLAAIKQGPGWGNGEYTISAHSTPLNSGSPLPSCLGKLNHKLTVVDGGAIASGEASLTHTMDCSEHTWDSKNLFSASEQFICVVTIKPKITGGVCNYTVQVQEKGGSPTYYNKVHYVEGGDALSIEMYRGVRDQAMADLLNAKRYVVRVSGSANDSSGCVGEYYNAQVPLLHE